MNVEENVVFWITDGVKQITAPMLGVVIKENDEEVTIETEGHMVTLNVQFVKMDVDYGPNCTDCGRNKEEQDDRHRPLAFSLDYHLYDLCAACEARDGALR